MRILLTLLTILTLTACDVRPLYGSRSEVGGGAGFMEAIDVKTPDTREGQLMRRYLREALGTSRGAQKAFVLDVTPGINKLTARIDQQGLVGRYSVNVNCNYTLTRLADNQVLTQGNARALSSYDVDISDFATTIAERDATERAIAECAEMVRLRIANRDYSKEPEKPKPAAVISPQTDWQVSR
jgi:hypothetical protein